jgi:hypothetical protein
VTLHKFSLVIFPSVLTVVGDINDDDLAPCLAIALAIASADILFVGFVTILSISDSCIVCFSSFEEKSVAKAHNADTDVAGFFNSDSESGANVFGLLVDVGVSFNWSGLIDMVFVITGEIVALESDGDDHNDFSVKAPGSGDLIGADLGL